MILKALKMAVAAAVLMNAAAVVAAGGAPAPEVAVAADSTGEARLATSPTTFRFQVWADSVLNGEYGRHEVGFTAGTYQQALNQLSLYAHAWGQELERKKIHYNSIEFRFLGQQ